MRAILAALAIAFVMPSVGADRMAPCDLPVNACAPPELPESVDPPDPPVTPGVPDAPDIPAVPAPPALPDLLPDAPGVPEPPAGPGLERCVLTPNSVPVYVVADVVFRWVSFPPAEEIVEEWSYPRERCEEILA